MNRVVTQNNKFCPFPNRLEGNNNVGKMTLRFDIFTGIIGPITELTFNISQTTAPIVLISLIFQSRRNSSAGSIYILMSKHVTHPL